MIYAFCAYPVIQRSFFVQVYFLFFGKNVWLQYERECVKIMQFWCFTSLKYSYYNSDFN